MKKPFYLVLLSLPFFFASCLDCSQGDLEIINDDDDGWEIYINDAYEIYLLPNEKYTVSLAEGRYTVRADEDNQDGLFNDSYTYVVDVEGCEEATVVVDD